MSDRGRSSFGEPVSGQIPGPPSLSEWERRLSAVTSHVGRMLHHRTIWRETWKIVERNPDFRTQPYLFTIYTEHYLTAQAIAVRRQRDSSKSHHQTLGRLLHLLARGAPTIQREWFCSLYSGDPASQEMARFDFDRFAEPGEMVASPRWFSDRQVDLEAASEKVRHFVNKRVAHLDGRDVPVATVTDLDEAIEMLRAIIVDLHVILRARGLVDPEPTTQFDWAADLRVPWLTDMPNGSG